MADYGTLIPINVVTGFLGSGKTTLLRRILEAPQLKQTAVLVNEFGEVGLDHHLIGHATENTLLLDNGCVCCAVREDLKGALRDLLSQQTRGDIPSFSRVIIETSGLADPVPIAYTLLSDQVIQHHFRLGNVITVIDAVNGESQLATFPESEKQLLVADGLVLTKTDLCAEDRIRSLIAELKRRNPGATVSDAAASSFDAIALVTNDLYAQDRHTQAVAQWRQATPDRNHQHTDGVNSFCLMFDQPLDWTAFGIWMTMLLNRHGDRVLRIKGLLNVAGMADPVVINGVQHIVHPPTHLSAWPDEDRRSRLIFIVRNLAPARLKESLAAFNALSNPADPSRLQQQSIAV